MIREIVIATRNKDKKKEIAELLSGLPVKVLSLSDFPGLPEVKEKGSTFEENAIAKAIACSGKTKRLCLADDSGLEVPALGGRPGVLSARFAGPKVTYKDNNEKILRLLRNASRDRRKARFVCYIALANSRGIIQGVKGTCSGRISESIRGNRGFGYDPVFIPWGYSKTFGELGESIKNKISHRSRALKKAKKIIAEYFGRYSP